MACLLDTNASSIRYNAIQHFSILSNCFGLKLIWGNFLRVFLVFFFVIFFTFKNQEKKKLIWIESSIQTNTVSGHKREVAIRWHCFQPIPSLVSILSICLKIKKQPIKLNKLFSHLVLPSAGRCGRAAPRQEEHHHVRDVALPGLAPECLHGSHRRGGDAASARLHHRHAGDHGATLWDPDSAALLPAGYALLFLFPGDREWKCFTF